MSEMPNRHPSLYCREGQLKERHGNCHLADEFIHDASRSHPVGSPMPPQETTPSPQSPANLTEMTQVPMHPSWPQYQPPPHSQDVAQATIVRPASKLGRPRGPKFVWSREQKEILEQYYSVNHFSNPEVFNFFLDKYDIPNKKVKCWFQNRRSKDRKKMKAAQQAGLDPFKALGEDNIVHMDKCPMKIPLQYPNVPPCPQTYRPRMPPMDHLQSYGVQKPGQHPIMPYHPKYPALVSQINSGTRLPHGPHSVIPSHFHNIRGTGARFGLPLEVEKPTTAQSPLAFSQSIVKQAASSPRPISSAATASTGSSGVTMTRMSPMPPNSTPPPYPTSAVHTFPYANNYHFYNQNTYNFYNPPPPTGICSAAQYAANYPGTVGYQDTCAVNLSLKTPVSSVASTASTMTSIPKQTLAASAETATVDSNLEKIQMQTQADAHRSAHMYVPVSPPDSDGNSRASGFPTRNQVASYNITQTPGLPSPGEKLDQQCLATLEGRQLTPLDLIQNFRNKCPSTTVLATVGVKEHTDLPASVQGYKTLSGTSDSKTADEASNETAATPEKSDETSNDGRDELDDTKDQEPSEDGSGDETDSDGSRSCSSGDPVYAPLEVQRHKQSSGDAVTTEEKHMAPQSRWVMQVEQRDTGWPITFSHLPESEGTTNENGWPPYPTSFYDENNNNMECGNQLEAARKIQMISQFMMQMQYQQMMQEPRARPVLVNDGSHERPGSCLSKTSGDDGDKSNI